MDRRAFLKSLPRSLLSRMRVFAANVTAPGSAVPAEQARAAHHLFATLDVSRCLAWGAGECQLCYLQCPLRDHAMVLEGGRPTIVVSACDGCGVCVDVCRTVNDQGAIALANL